jgi:TonB family protein
MTKKILSALLPAVFLATHPFAQGQEAPAKSKAPAKKSAGKGGAQTSGAYVPKAKAAMAKRWATELAPHMAEFSQGDLNVTFKLNAEGAVTEFTVLKNSSNDAFAKFCETFVRETKFEKPPASSLTEGQLEIPFTFTIL